MSDPARGGGCGYASDRARRIAHAFLPRRWFGNRYHYHYSVAKLRSDPLYPGVVAALEGTTAPLLDLGCGIGLLAHALRDAGSALPYLGVDVDAGKVARACDAAARARLAGVDFAVADLARTLPAHAGSVALLDVLQYLPDEAQSRLLQGAAAMLVPGARLVIRTGLVDGSPRSRATRVGDRLSNLVGWMRTPPRHHPTRAVLAQRLAAAGLAATFAPLHGNTPFNNWLVVASLPRDRGFLGATEVASAFSTDPKSRLPSLPR